MAIATGMVTAMAMATAMQRHQQQQWRWQRQRWWRGQRGRGRQWGWQRWWGRWWWWDSNGISDSDGNSNSDGNGNSDGNQSVSGVLDSLSLVESKWCDYVKVEADSNLKLLPTSILDLYKVIEHIDMLSMGIQYQPYTVTTTLLLGSEFGVLGHLWSHFSGWGVASISYCLHTYTK